MEPTAHHIQFSFTSRHLGQGRLSLAQIAQRITATVVHTCRESTTFRDPVRPAATATEPLRLQLQRTLSGIRAFLPKVLSTVGQMTSISHELIAVCESFAKNLDLSLLHAYLQKYHQVYLQVTK